MCGIAGTLQKRNSDQSELSALEKMIARLAHRGPDGFGHTRAKSGEWEVALGHRRLSIIDLEGGKQPLSTEDGSLTTTFNGEIYNFQDLRKNLKKLGHRFLTQSDTEVLVHHYQEFGIDGISELNGMFAFAIWDASNSELILARDRSGIKPLFYARLPDGGVAFASELAALLEHPKIPRRISTQALSSYFFSDYVPHPESMIHGVSKLEPGHTVSWKAGELSVPRAFWTVGSVKPMKNIPDETRLSHILENHLGHAVKRQLVSDVPLGVFLSGGIDSSAVAALAQKHSQEPIRTFSIAFEDSTFDESAYAQKVASHIGSRHTVETLNPSSLTDTLEGALLSLDEPMADPSILPTYLLSRLASRHVKVALGGDGGDELWAGYPTYRAHRFGSAYGAIPGFIRTGFKKFISMLPVSDRYQSLEWKLKRFTERFDSDAQVRHLRWMSSADLGSLQMEVPGTLSFTKRPSTGDELNALLALDFQTYLPGSVLAKVDRASMAHGLEVRPPFLDNEMIRFSFSLPSHYKLRGSTGKYLLKKALTGLIPDEIIHRPKKGFGIPLARWLAGPLKPFVMEALNDSPLWDAMDRNIFVQWNQEHQNRIKDHSKPLWALIVLDHWVKREGIQCADKFSSPARLAS